MLTGPLFSILIPTWNNLEYLKLCYRSIIENSSHEHEILFHVNNGSDGTLEWLKENNLDFAHSKENIGICRSVNGLFSKSKCRWVLYLNDDMYVLPGWDKALLDAVKQQQSDLFLISGTMIEHTASDNSCVVLADYGKSIEHFQEDALKAEVKKNATTDWNGATWPPSLVSRATWEKAGGFSEEFSPGMYSDPDFAMKLWQAGCRNFHGVGNSLVYHFQAKSTSKVKKNDGRKQFKKKWGISTRTFYKYYLRMGKPYCPDLEEPVATPGLIFQKIRGQLNRWFL